MSSHQGLVSCLLVSVLLFPILCSALDRNSFPHGFQFGFSTSAFQVEGAAHEDGRGPSIWDTFCSIPARFSTLSFLVLVCLFVRAFASISCHINMGSGPFLFLGKILGGGNGEVAADVYHRYKEDVQILKNLGTDLYRFSISWPRIFPGGSARNGGVNSKGVQYYHNLINELIENGIEPCATIFHWDVPQVLEDEYGGFRSKRILDDYSEFAEFCFKEFGDRVKMWVTINEPSIFATHGYGNGINAPGRCSPPACPAGDSSREPYLVSHVLLLAHSRAVRIYRSKYQESQKGRIGIAVHSDWYMPLSSSEEDVDATERVLDNTLGLFLDPLVFGDYPKSVKKLVGSRLPKFTEEESIGIKASFDFIGMNHYVTLYVMDNSTAILSPPADGPSQDEPDSPEVPDTFSITTSYVALDDGQPLENVLDDRDRIQFIKDTLNYTLQAMREGADVRGYLLWSYIDNFEWDNGYPFRLGLYYVNFTGDDMRRIPKASALWFREAMATSFKSPPRRFGKSALSSWSSS
ncbi:hypothetical protein ACLOJK_040130 [Asimina triloba]